MAIVPGARAAAPAAPHGRGGGRGGHRGGTHGHGGGGGGHGGGHRHRGGKHGNPPDLDRFIARMEDPERAAWQKPDEVVRALGLRGGEVVCDLGAGPGYFALRLARAVGPKGRVLAADVEPAMIAALRDRLARGGVKNVTPILAPDGEPLLPPVRCDLVLVVDTFHHFPDGAAALRALASRLRPGGRIVNIDFHRREMPVGPPLEHKVAREDFLATASAAGLELAGEADFLPYQYFLMLEPARKGAGPRRRSGRPPRRGGGRRRRGAR